MSKAFCIEFYNLAKYSMCWSCVSSWSGYLISPRISLVNNFMCSMGSRCSMSSISSMSNRSAMFSYYSWNLENPDIWSQKLCMESKTSEN